MKSITIYKIFTYLLLPFALIMLLTFFPMLMAAFASPTALLPLFMLACIIIYIVCSYTFLQKGLVREMACKKSLRDWIKVNAYVSIAFVILMLAQISVLLSNSSETSKQLMDAFVMQSNGNVPPQLTTTLIQKMLNFIMYFMFIYSIILGVHIFITLRFIKLYNHIFSK